MSDKDKRIIPDGAHHSGLMKDYGGAYNPNYQTELAASKRHAEAAESLLRDAVIRADAAEARNAQLVEALRDVPCWRDTHYRQQCNGCSVFAYFNDTPTRATVKHKAECWVVAIEKALAANAETEKR